MSCTMSVVGIATHFLGMLLCVSLLCNLVFFVNLVFFLTMKCSTFT